MLSIAVELAMVCRAVDASACAVKDGALHINEDWVYVEIVDGKGAPVPPAERGDGPLVAFPRAWPA